MNKYGRVTSEFKEFGEEEPLFVLRAQDRLAPLAVDVYAALLRAAGLDNQADDVEIVATEMQTWQTLNADRVKLPD